MDDRADLHALGCVAYFLLTGTHVLPRSTQMQSLIDVGRLQPGQRLLLNGAGGVGTFALQIAQHYGVEITAVDKPGKLDALRAMGAAHVVDYLHEDFTRRGTQTT